MAERHPYTSDTHRQQEAHSFFALTLRDSLSIHAPPPCSIPKTHVPNRTHNIPLSITTPPFFRRDGCWREKDIFGLSSNDCWGIRYVRGPAKSPLGAVGVSPWLPKLVRRGVVDGSYSGHNPTPTLPHTNTTPINAFTPERGSKTSYDRSVR